MTAGQAKCAGTSDSFFTATHALLQFAARFHTEGPGSISDGVYWLQGGRLERLHAWIEDNRPDRTVGRVMA